MKRIEAYKEILEVVTKHEAIVVSSGPISSVKKQLENLIAIEDISSLFGIEITDRYAEPDNIGLLGFARMLRMGESMGREISWSDDGSQPDNELLYVLSFPSGAYTFSKDYPTESFNAFFEELASFGAKYRDTSNHNLYFTHETAGKVHAAFDEIFRRHRDGVGDELKRRKISDLQKQLAELEGEQ